jgi:hypothetical protein
MPVRYAELQRMHLENIGSPLLVLSEFSSLDVDGFRHPREAVKPGEQGTGALDTT